MAYILMRDRSYAALPHASSTNTSFVFPALDLHTFGTPAPLLNWRRTNSMPALNKAPVADSYINYQVISVNLNSVEELERV